MRRIQSFNVIQTSKVLGVLYGVLGLVAWLLMAITSLMARRNPGYAELLVVFFAPILYGVAGFAFTAIFCWLYNVIAKRLGGIEVEITG